MLSHQSEHNQNRSITHCNKVGEAMQYQGQILDGQMHGQGKLTYENGEYYDGEWVRGEFVVSSVPSMFLMIYSGKRHGRGEYLYNDGSKYIGTWDADRINGEGTSWYPNGNKYAKEQQHCDACTDIL